MVASYKVIIMFGVLIMEEPQILYGTEGTVLGKWQGEIKLKSMKLLVSKNQGDDQLPFGGSRPRSLFKTRPESAFLWNQQ